MDTDGRDRESVTESNSAGHWCAMSLNSGVR